MRALEIQVDWIPIKNRDGSVWIFPNPFPPDYYGGPAVYRWLINPADQRDAGRLYIGETHSLRDRARGVLNACSELQELDGTNSRLNNEFRSATASGSSVTLETAVFDEFSFNGVVLSPHDLFHEFKRKALEDLFLSCSLASGGRLLNLCADPGERCQEQMREFTKSPQKVKEMMKIWSPSLNSEEVRQRFVEADEKG